tara:strand:+ start:1270 stop:1641 length:372 start_codon:yes stop_codon:yes gene_type:complete
MDTSLALTIIGTVLTLIGVTFIAIPKIVNDKVMSDLPSDAIDTAAFFRVVNGALGLALGMVAIYCRNLPSEFSKTVLLSLGTGFFIFLIALASCKIRRFGDVPIQPVIIFTILAILAYYSALF